MRTPLGNPSPNRFDNASHKCRSARWCCGNRASLATSPSRSGSSAESSGCESAECHLEGCVRRVPFGRLRPHHLWPDPPCDFCIFCALSSHCSTALASLSLPRSLSYLFLSGHLAAQRPREQRAIRLDPRLAWRARQARTFEPRKQRLWCGKPNPARVSFSSRLAKRVPPGIISLCVIAPRRCALWLI